mmetsp:Transcript_4006/g.14012  ORF Transcript_4006/g.14012 Transcript_4006/m.14012 type:complete len:292 (+) Transcript_4006:182-1057(+)|eukprot:CAMPEP_0183797068 /NCGR_PEP_ID=MMETSP0803_2-20130417/14356_1 /TAXON_ID=195967 /ORGANISM="Crustomastix stigmata, Strain CCMP3273" /LENGTH=291 /DNA_ID=CAMNT_0026041727 /DNA_START=177 /DNA_END=1052 /DNA_ORIENTATION=+
MGSANSKIRNGSSVLSLRVSQKLRLTWTKWIVWSKFYIPGGVTEAHTDGFESFIQVLRYALETQILYPLMCMSSGLKYGIRGVLPAREVPYSDACGALGPIHIPLWSLKQASHIFNSLKGKVIVEIGSGLYGIASGNSLLIWLQNSKAETVYAVDCDKAICDSLADLKLSYGDKLVTVHDTGERFLVDLSDVRIDLLYLDFAPRNISFDPSSDGFLQGNTMADEYATVYNHARSKMAPTSLILIDDTDIVGTWKLTNLLPAIRKDGYQIVWGGRQTLFARGLNPLRPSVAT